MRRFFTLHTSVEAFTSVGDTFHVTPLIRLAQTSSRYNLLILNRSEIKLFQGNGLAIEEVALAPGVPRTIDEALGTELTKPHQTVASHGGIAPDSAMRHGTSTKQEEIEVDEERFFRAVDRAITEFHSRKSSLPLILAALPEYHALFRRVSLNPFLKPTGVEADVNALSPKELGQLASKILLHEFHGRVTNLVDEFNSALSRGLATSDVPTAARAAAQSRVASLLVETGRRIPGRLDRATGDITPVSPEDSPNDVLDDLSQLILRNGGEVLVLPAAEMPTANGLAATFRF